jgi:DNA-directed RNA polymerase subunit M
MMFCPKCGSLLTPKTEKNKKVLACSCGYSSKKSDGTSIKETMKQSEKEIAVVDSKDSILPEIEAECSKCGNDKAYFWTQQTRAGDEPETKFLKCTKCSHTWRDYS